MTSYIDGFVEERLNSFANALELLTHWSCIFFSTNWLIWCNEIWSTLFQVMACCLMAPSHYFNQCWLTTIGSCAIHLGTVSLEVLKTKTVSEMSWIHTFKSHNQSPFPGANDIIARIDKLTLVQLTEPKLKMAVSICFLNHMITVCNMYILFLGCLLYNVCVYKWIIYNLNYSLSNRN